MIVAFGYQSRVGKDTCAEMLVEELESRGVVVHRTSFARALKAIAHETFVHYGLRSGDYYETAEGEPYRTKPLDEIGLTPVQIWILLGQAMRGIYERVWVDRVMAFADTCPKGEVLVLSDLRFPNEMVAIRSRRGMCVKVSRPGSDRFLQGSDHELDKAHWEWQVRNDHSLDWLRTQVRGIADYVEAKVRS